LTGSRLIITLLAVSPHGEDVSQFQRRDRRPSHHCHGSWATPVQPLILDDICLNLAIDFAPQAGLSQ
jgi:hypothetical protein